MRRSLRRLSFVSLFALGCGTEITLVGHDGDDDTLPDGPRNPDTAGPVAICGATPTPAAPLATVDLIGENSYDPDDNPLIAYQWGLFSQPDGSAAELPPGAANRPGFVPDVAGDYIATLEVTDDAGNRSDPCTARLSVVPEHAIWVEAWWTVQGDDIDLLLVREDGDRTEDDLCAPGACNLDWGTFGDFTDDPHHLLNDVSGTGPELIGVTAPDDDAFTVAITDRPSGLRTSDNAITVVVWIDGERAWEGTKVLPDEPAYVPFAAIDWPSRTVTPR